MTYDKELEMFFAKENTPTVENTKGKNDSKYVTLNGTKFRFSTIYRLYHREKDIGKCPSFGVKPFPFDDLDDL